MTTTRSDRYIASSTSCVTITTVLFSRSQIGVFDLLNAARAAANDPGWLGFYNEAYLLVALVYFCHLLRCIPL
ncbi:hypothetical protein A6U97_17300 [Agrobacterium tumefaciens]|jgi:hypothetical protein|uniref:hypothetical protein n=1 Tax=Agrobacterium tumefaciens TaxID=358 RepID=UPI0008100CA7|nr:hypothetical protein A6U97_17300 [Agrobacterium tumefaciens]